MAEGDNRARQGGVAGSTGDTEIAGGVAKANPTAKSRVAEDLDTVAGRSGKYAQAGEKDVLPEHQARRDAYPHIHAGNNV